MDAEIDTETDATEVVDVDLLFRKPKEITDYELVKTFWIDSNEDTNSAINQSAPLPTEPDQESKSLQPLALQTLETTEDDGSSCSHSEDDRLPEDVLNEPMDDEVFEDESKNVETDLLFRQPTNTEMELVYTISKGATVNLDELEDEDEDVDVDLWFREPTDTRFELVYTIPLMEDVSVDSLGETLEDVPTAEELDNVVEEAAEFTFKPIENDEEKTETETLTAEVVTVVEKNQDEHVGEGSRDFIEKVKLTSNDTFDDFDGEEEAFQNAFVKSVETPETPTPRGDLDQEDAQDSSISDVLKDAAEKLQIIQNSENLEYSNNRDTADSDNVVQETASAPDLLDVGTPEEDLPEISNVDHTEESASSEHPVADTCDNVDDDVPKLENVAVPQVSTQQSSFGDSFDHTGNPITAEIDTTPGKVGENFERFDVVPVEEADVPTSGQQVDSVILNASETAQMGTDSTPSDFAQLESISASEDIPDVYKTLDSLRNEDVFPKEDTPSPPEVPKREDTPEANSQETATNKVMQEEVKLEDSGIVATFDIVDVEEDVIKEAMNSEDVVKTTNGMEASDSFGRDSLNLNKDKATLEFESTEAAEYLRLEDSGIADTPDIIDLEQEVIADALNKEDVVKYSDDVKAPEVPEGLEASETAEAVGNQSDENESNAVSSEMDVINQQQLSLEDAGDVPIAEPVKLCKTDIEEAFNSEDVVFSNLPGSQEAPSTGTTNETEVNLSKMELEDGAAPAGLETVETTVGLEESGTCYTPDVIDLEKEVIADGLNGEEVLKPSEDVIASNVLNELESETIENQPGENEPNVISDVVDSIGQQHVSLEDAGNVPIAEPVNLCKTDIEEAFNSEDVVPSNLPKAQELQSTDIINEGTVHEVKLEDGGDSAAPGIVGLDDDELRHALNSEDVVATTEETVTGLPKSVDANSFRSAEIEEGSLEAAEPVLKLEETDKVNALQNTVSEHIENEESHTSHPEGIKELQSSESADQPEQQINPTTVSNLEESGVTDSPDVVGLQQEDIIDALNSEVVKPSDVETALSDAKATADNEVEDFQTELSLEDSGVSATPDIVDLEKEDIVDALGGEDVQLPEQLTKLIFPESLSVEENHATEAESSVDDSQTEEDARDQTTIKDSNASEIEDPTGDEKSIVEKLVSMVEHVLPANPVLPSEDVLNEDHTEVKPTKDSETDGEMSNEHEKSPNPAFGEESMVQKVISIVENVLPAGTFTSSENTPAEEAYADVVTSQTEEQKEPTPVQDSDNIKNDDVDVQDGSIMQKLVSMVENVLPVDAVILSEYVERIEKKSEYDEPVDEKYVLKEVSDEMAPVQSSMDSEYKTSTPQEDEQESSTLVETLSSVIENADPVLPSEDALSDDKTEERAEDNVFENTNEELAKTDDSQSVQPEDGTPTQESTVDGSKSIVDKLESMVDSLLPVSDVIPSEDVLNEEHVERTDDYQVETASDKTEVSEEEHVPADSDTKEKEEPEQASVLDKLVSVVTEILPTGIVPPGENLSKEQEQPNEPSESSGVKNQDGVAIAEVIATADIILPVEESATEKVEKIESVEFTSETVDEKKETETSHDAEDKEIIATADIILPVEEETQNDHEVLETPFDAEGFISESVESQVPVEETEMRQEEQPLEEEKATIVEELVAMAVDILPIDGTVAKVIETNEDASTRQAIDSNDTLNQTDSLDSSKDDASEEREKVDENSTELGEKEYAFPESEDKPGNFKREKRSDDLVEEVTPDETTSTTNVADIDESESPVEETATEKQEDQPIVGESASGNVDHVQITTVEVDVEHESEDQRKDPEEENENDVEETLTKTAISSEESSAPHKITDIHFTVPKIHEDYGNDYVPFGTEPSKVEFNNPEDAREEEEDVVAELNFHPIRQWKDEDVISLQSLKSLVAEVGCTTDIEEVPRSPKLQTEDSESTLKILKVVPSEPSLMELDISNDPSVIHVPIPLLEPATKYLEEMVEWIISDAVKEVSEMEVVTESELSEMVPEESENETDVPEPLVDLKLPYEDDEKTPEPEQVLEETPIEITKVLDAEATPTIPQRPPRAPKTESSKSSDPPKSRVRFGPLNIKLGRSYSEEQQKELVESLERPLTIIIASEQKTTDSKLNDDTEAPSPLSPNTLDEYEHVPMMDMHSVPHSPQEKQEEPDVVKTLERPVEVIENQKPEVLKEEPKVYVTETKILGPGKSMEYVGNDEEEGSECLDSIGDLSEKTIQRFNTSIDDPSIRRDSFSSISSFGDRQKFRTAIENIRQDLLPFQSSVSQYLDPSLHPSQQLLVTNLSMDSPSDLSPNAPPVGFENTAQYLEKMQQQQEDRPSAEGSIDSSGFEKVDHESLDDYSAPVHDPMQKSVFGSLGADADDIKPGSQDDGFVFIERNEANDGAKKKMSSHHDDVIEKNYFRDDAATAKLLESPIAEEARKLVQDAVESASEYSKHAVEEGDEIGRELLDNAEHKIEQAKEPVAEALHKAYDGLGDFVHETVPEAVHDFVEEVGKKLPESPVPEKVETPEPLVDIHDSVDKVHDEIDNFLRSGRDPTPPLVEADEDAPSDEKPQFGNQTPEEDETTFDRNGPLTIPEEVEKAAAAQKHDEDLDDFDPLVTSNTGAAFGAAVGAAASEALTEEEIFGHQKFETVPRPPTPPKDISDEDVKPSTVNLGPAHHHSHPSSPHHSILKHHGEAWIDFKTVPPCVLDVIYWRDPKKSAIVLSLALLALFILAKYPLLTVITYSLLLALGAAAGFRIFKKVESQIKKTDTQNPFSEILSQDISLPQEKVHAQADVFVEHATCIANTLKKLVFVESPLESIKFGLVLWSMTYVASWFSGFTLATLGLLGVFSIPKVYEANQDAIDPHLATISGHLKNVQNLIDEKLPFLRSAPVAAEEKKDQ